MRVATTTASTCSIAVSSQVNVHIDLHEPLTADLPGGRYICRRVSLWVDDPRQAAVAIRRLIDA